MRLQYTNHIDCSEEEQPPAILECDVVIVGTGAGGGIAAEILARSGLKVIMVEEGGLNTAKDFKLQEKQAYAELYQEVAGRQTKDKAIQILQGKTVGGSTTVNWTSSFRTPKQTLNHWQQEHDIQGLDDKNLAPWFAWVEKRLNIKPWTVAPNANNQLLANGLKKLGWHNATIPRNVKGCANLGYCGMGCPIDAKQSMLVSCIPMALNLGAQLITKARAERLIMARSEYGSEQSSDRVRGVWLTSLDKYGQVKQKNVTQILAKHSIIAAGAIGTPALLMRSKLDKCNPNIGKRTFLHPVTASIAQMPEQVNGFAGAPQSIYSDQFLWRDGVKGELGYKLEVPPLHPVLASTLLRQHGQQHFDLMQNFTRYQANLALIRDGFHSQSNGGQVLLDSDEYPELDYPLNEVLWRSFKDAMLKMAEIQFAAGAEKVLPLHMDAQPYKTWPQAQRAIKNLPTKALRWQLMSAHVMGGSAMGANTNNSVCDSLGQVHEVENLSVMDGSLFPTSLGVNPQLTIYAISCKLSVSLVQRLQQTMSIKLPDDLAVLSRAIPNNATFD
jgi:choline dehydrogenase-like flavoprotein